MALPLFRKALESTRLAAKRNFDSRLATCGSEPVCTLTMHDIVRGLRGKPVVPHFTSWLDAREGFGFNFPDGLHGSLKEVLCESLSPKANSSVERWTFRLFVGRGPSEEEANEVQSFMREACNEASLVTGGLHVSHLDAGGVITIPTEASTNPMHPMLRQAAALLHNQPRFSKMAKVADMEGGLGKDKVHELFCEDSLRAISCLLRATTQSTEPWADDEDYGAFLARAVLRHRGVENGWYHDDFGRCMYIRSLGHDPNASSLQYISVNGGSSDSLPRLGTLESECIRLSDVLGMDKRGHVCRNTQTIFWNDGTQWHPGKISADSRAEFARLFTMIHADHTAGSVVTHATTLLASAWCDPFMAYAAGILGFAGPLHGRANQEFVLMLRELHKWLGDGTSLPAPDALHRWAAQRLAAGKMVYGFGCKHPYPDPRYSMMAEFAENEGLCSMDRSPSVYLALHLGRELPAVLKEHCRAASPFPNPDAISGVLLQECLGLTDETLHPAMLAQARSIGALAAASWHRMLSLPIERPQSLWIPVAAANL